MKTMKKIAAVVLALAVIASFASLFTVSAADPENLALTATAKSNITKFFGQAGGKLSVINDGQKKGRTLGYWDGGISWYGYEFSTATTINKVVVLQDADEDKSIRDLAVDVKLADGTWKRVAEKHYAENPGQGAEAIFKFAPVSVLEVRVYGNVAYAVDRNYFSVSEIEVYNDPSVVEADYTAIEKAPSIKQVIQKAFADRDTNVAKTAQVSVVGHREIAGIGPLSAINDGQYSNRTIPFYNHGGSTEYYEFKFATATEINTIVAISDTVEGDAHTSGMAFDVQDENGYWIRVAECHELGKLKHGTPITAQFETIKAKAIRVSGHAKEMARWETGKNTADMFFSLSEIEIYKAAGLTEAEYSEVKSSTTYNIPEYEPKKPTGSDNNGGSSNSGSSNSGSSNSGSSNTGSDNKLPQTGETSNVFAVMAALVAAGFVCVVATKARKA